MDFDEKHLSNVIEHERVERRKSKRYEVGDCELCGHDAHLTEGICAVCAGKLHLKQVGI